MLPKFVLIGEFEEVERLASILSGILCNRGLTGDETEEALHKFRCLYAPHYNWNTAKIDSASDSEIAYAIQGMARLNGLFSQVLNTLADILTAPPMVH